ncbi:serine/threonine-protein kinase [Streptomyces sp. NBC_00647]|uniref:serine/threonine-protein kinase n=1 Tax=Streptomyces sp. NBC_00647 TaxID=2975796 RepID=UPI00324965DD
MTLLKDDPTWVGTYRLESRLGSGGMGVVYRACSASGQVLALKVIRRQWAANPEFRARFELEVAAARMVHSKHTVPITDADPHAPDPWMASPYVPGESLAVRVEERGPLDEPELRALARALAGALRDVHRAGVVHRDLKPGNVLLSERGPLIIDFGVSRAVDGRPLTAAGQIVGTPAFMAPEQFTTPSEAGPAADVFSLGCVLVFAATGRSPFEAGSPYASAHLSMHEEPDLSTLPEFLHDLVTACLRKLPAERPTPEELLLTLTPSEAPRKSARSTALRRFRALAVRWLGRRVPAWLMALTVLASVATGIGTMAAWPPSPATVPATRHTQTDWHPWETRLAGNGDIQRCSAYDEVIYCTTGNGSVARINTYNNGRIAWTSDAPADQYANFTPPNGGTAVLGISHGMVFIVRDRARHDPEPDDAWVTLPSRLYALDAGTGKTLWTRLLPDNTTDIPGFQAAQLVRETNTLYLTDLARREIRAINVATRETRWKRPLAPREILAATPDGLYAIRTSLKRAQQPNKSVITAVEASTGRTAWSTTKAGILDFAASAPGALYLSERNKDLANDVRNIALVRLDTRTRTDLRVHIPGGFEIRLAPNTTQSIKDHYGVPDRNFFYIVAYSGDTIAVDTKSKRIRWHRTPGTIVPTGMPTLVGTQLLYPTRFGEVFAVDTHTGDQLWQTHPRTASVKRPWTSSSPVMIVNGRLYVASRNSVFVVDASPSPPALDQQT